MKLKLFLLLNIYMNAFPPVIEKMLRILHIENIEELRTQGQYYKVEQIIQDYEFWQKSKEEQEKIHKTAPWAGRESLLHIFNAYFENIMLSKEDFIIISEFYHIQQPNIIYINDYCKFFICNHSIKRLLSQQIITNEGTLSININNNYSGWYITYDTNSQITVGYMENGKAINHINIPIFHQYYHTIETLLFQSIDEIIAFINPSNANILSCNVILTINNFFEQLNQFELSLKKKLLTQEVML